jgi:uncharacterized membrane protein
MAKTIGNPASWLAQAFAGAGHHISENAASLGGHGAETGAIAVREIELGDLRQALRRGVEDFAAFRTDVLMICLIYPFVGLCLAAIAFNGGHLALIFPLVAGFALIGPVAGVGFYELSRRREAGQEAGWGDAFAVLSGPSLGPILVLGAYLFALFVAWMIVAWWIWRLTLGPELPASLAGFADQVLTTPDGWAMIVVGIGAGFLFAASVLAMSLVAFPLLVDRDVGLPAAVATSLAVARKNPRTVAAWGAIVAVSLVIGAIPALLGLVVVLPVLGHATWHLYRRVVEPPRQ